MQQGPTKYAPKEEEMNFFLNIKKYPANQTPFTRDEIIAFSSILGAMAAKDKATAMEISKPFGAAGKARMQQFKTDYSEYTKYLTEQERVSGEKVAKAQENTRIAKAEQQEADARVQRTLDLEKDLLRQAEAARLQLEALNFKEAELRSQHAAVLNQQQANLDRDAAAIAARMRTAGATVPPAGKKQTVKM